MTITKRKKRAIIELFIATALLAIIVFVYASRAHTPTLFSQPPLLFVGDFETGDLTGFYAAGNTPEIVSTSHPVRAGDYSMRAYVHRYESPINYRTMALPQPDDQGPPGRQAEFTFNIGDEYWIGFAVYVQNDLVSDPPGLSDVIFQCQPKPDAGENYQPNLALVIDTQEEGGELVNYWRIWRRWDPRSASGGVYQYSEWFQMMLPMEDEDIGSWTDWVFHIIWDYHNDGDGLLQVWRNGVEVLNVSGGNCRNDRRGPYSSFGVYKWGYDDPYTYNSQWRLLYFDEFRIGDANATYEDVAPPDAFVPTPTPTTTLPPPTLTPTEYCPPDPPTRTPWPRQPTLTPRPTYTPRPTHTPRPTYTPIPTPICPPTATLAPNPSPSPYPTATHYPTSMPYPTATHYPTSMPYPATAAIEVDNKEETQ